MIKILIALCVFWTMGCQKDTASKEASLQKAEVHTASPEHAYQKGNAIKSEEIIEYELVKNGAEYTKGTRKGQDGYNTDRINTYDKQGNLTESYLSEPGKKPRLISKYTYNKAGKEIKGEEYYENGRLSVTEYVYDNQNRIITEEHKIQGNSAGLKNTLDKYEYGTDKYTYKILQHDFDEATKQYVLMNTVFVKTDKQGNIATKQYMAADSTNYYRKEFTTYNNKNKPLEVRFEQEGPQTKTVYSYNAQGDAETENSTLGLNVYTTKYLYTYDKYGNWITKIVLHDDKDIQSFIQRTITYY